MESSMRILVQMLWWISINYHNEKSIICHKPFITIVYNLEMFIWFDVPLFLKGTKCGSGPDTRSGLIKLWDQHGIKVAVDKFSNRLCEIPSNFCQASYTI